MRMDFFDVHMAVRFHKIWTPAHESRQKIKLLHTCMGKAMPVLMQHAQLVSFRQCFDQIIEMLDQIAQGVFAPKLVEHCCHERGRSFLGS